MQCLKNFLFLCKKKSLNGAPIDYPKQSTNIEKYKNMKTYPDWTTYKLL